MSQLDERIAQFRKMATDDPDNELGHFRLGQLLLEDNQPAEAVKSFKKALELDENLADAEFGLAEALRFSGSKSEALEAYKAYLKMDPTGKDAGTTSTPVTKYKFVIGAKSFAASYGSLSNTCGFTEVVAV